MSGLVAPEASSGGELVDQLQIDRTVRHLIELGFDQVLKTDNGAESGIDLDAIGAVARLSTHGTHISLADLQRLRGAATGSSEALFYASEDFPAEAIEFANLRHVALFQFAGAETIEPRSLSAERLVRFGWLTTAPNLATEARENLATAIQDYAQTVVGVGEQFALCAEEALQNLIDERDGEIDVDLKSSIDFVSEKSRLLAEIFGSLDGEHTYVIHEFIRRVEQAEALIHTLAERLEIDYSDLETDAFLRTYQRKST